MTFSPKLSDNEIDAGVESGSIDDSLLCLLPWMALRHDFADGSFAGKADEQAVHAGFLTAQAGVILATLGLREKLPYIVRAKLDAWPAFTAAELAKPASATPLALTTRDNLTKDPVAFGRLLESFQSSDGGFMLNPGPREPGSMAAAHHLLVEVRPAWFGLRNRPVPPVEDAVASHFLTQLFPTFAT